MLIEVNYIVYSDAIIVLQQKYSKRQTHTHTHTEIKRNQLKRAQILNCNGTLYAFYGDYFYKKKTLRNR